MIMPSSATAAATATSTPRCGSPHVAPAYTATAPESSTVRTAPVSRNVLWKRSSALFGRGATMGPSS